MKPLNLIILVLFFLLTSCEGFIRIQGHAFDNISKQPVENVQVLLILRGRDTIRTNKLEYDTIPYKDRLALRKKGIKDNFKLYDAKGFSKPINSVTDSSGFFSVGNFLVGCVPKCPTCKLMFIKDGYNPVIIKTNSIFQDSVKVFLEMKELKN